MTSREAGFLCVRVMAVSATVAAAALAGAQTPGAGQASGRFTVDGKAFTFTHAYAQVWPDREGKDVLWVLLTEKAATADQLADRLRDVAASEQLNALAFALDARNGPSDWRWHHPALSIGCGLCSDLQFKPSSRTNDEIAGTVFSAKPQAFQGKKYEFRASFRASIRRPSEVANATPAQKAAIRKLQSQGYTFRPVGFLTAASQPDIVRLFLDAGMKPDALEPGMTETVLLSVANADCTDAQSRPKPIPDALKVVSMLTAAGADPNYRSPEGRVPLMNAYRCAEMADALLKAGAKLTAPSSTPGETVGRYLMDAAIGFGRADMVRVLVARGYDVKQDGARLMESARDEPEIQKILRGAGALAAAPATRAAAKGEPPARASASATTAGALRAPRSPEQARQELARRKLAFTEEVFWGRLMEFDAGAVLLFLEAGMAPNGRRSPPQNDTPLLFVTSAGCAIPFDAQKAAAAEIALALIAHKADANAKSDNDTTPLLHAAESCPPEVVRALLKGGASTKVKAKGGATPMMMAVMMDREENVRALIDGAYDVKGELGSLLPLAAGKPRIEALLKQAAARK